MLWFRRRPRARCRALLTAGQLFAPGLERRRRHLVLVLVLVLVLPVLLIVQDPVVATHARAREATNLEQARGGYSPACEARRLSGSLDLSMLRPWAWLAQRGAVLAVGERV